MTVDTAVRVLDSALVCSRIFLPQPDVSFKPKSLSAAVKALVKPSCEYRMVSPGGGGEYSACMFRCAISDTERAGCAHL